MQKHILVIEDNKTIAMYEEQTLRSAGYDVLVAHNFDEAVELITAHKKEIVLSIVDINLPDDKEKALEYLLKHNIPSIAMTGSFHKKLRDKIVDKNVIDYIVLEDDQQLELLQATVHRIISNEHRKVLIVDDSKPSRFALRTLLQSQNFTIFEAADAIEALKILKEHNDINIALIDYEMPKMNGAELTRILRKSFSRSELSILAISVHTAPIVTVEFLKAGANDFITKPYVKEEVIARIGVHIDMLNQHKQLQDEILHRKCIEDELKFSQKQAESASLAKSNFLANMSHEVRTPMNAIIGFVDIMYKNEQSPQQQEKLKIIKDSGASLLEIIDDILDFSKIEHGKIEIDRTLFKTKEPFVQVSRLFLERAKEKNVVIKLHVDSHISEHAYGDVTRVKQVLSNLLSNAIKFTHSNTTVTINVTPITGTNSLLCQVKDEGPGIPKEKQSKIFHMFEQEDCSTTRKFGGSGLGLTISRSLVELMRGKLYLESEEGKGANFLFEIELFKDIEHHLSKQALAAEKNELLPANDALLAKVLLAEDNKANQLLMKLLLNELGLDVTVCNDGLEAIEACKEDDFALILMDENMPNLNGIEATAQIRELKCAEHTPIIAVTANALKGDRQRFLDAGMDDYIAKPIDAVILEKKLRKYLA